MEELLKYIKDSLDLHPIYSQKEIVIYRGSFDCTTLFIGEAPGAQEELQHKSFVGRSGQILDKWISANNIEKYFITNTIYFKPTNSNGKIRPPTNEEMAYFRPYVDMIISRLAPKAIVLIGSSACKSILNMSIKDCYGRVFSYKGIKTIGVYHPAWWLRHGQTGDAAFAKAYSVLTGGCLNGSEIEEGSNIRSTTDIEADKGRE